MEGTLFASNTTGSYAIGSPDNPPLIRGQAIEVFLGGHWIPGHIGYSRNYFESPITDTTQPRNVGAYAVSSDKARDIVTETSEESFPASDPPSWATNHKQVPPTQGSLSTTSSYYFIAAADSSICGLCTGMQIRTREAPSL
ncbi:MAG TPA: hypothetical protein VFB60_21040 [Ktedonobacteraceae bacterium]|nr:hypothetical protein [Ktedonobacteraceae bacterium]